MNITPEAPTRASTWPSLPQLRLGSGLVLFVYAALHLTNHALGIVSLDAMETMRRGMEIVWRSPPGTVLLAGAAAVHVGLALFGLYRRRTWRMPRWEAAQVVLGLLIPPLLAAHVLGTRGLWEQFGTLSPYASVLLALWPGEAPRQLLLVLLTWAHGCVGVHFWLRFRPWYGHVVPVLLPAAVLLPAVSLIGFADAGRLVRGLAADPAWVRDLHAAVGWPGEAGRVWLARTEGLVLAGFALALAVVPAARLVRHLVEHRGGRVRIAYSDGRTVSIRPGTTVLEASRAAAIPHASICGGRGRCSTCRVRVGEGAAALPPPDPAERRVLDRLRLPDNVRLACQLRPVADVAVAPLLAAGTPPRGAAARHRQGEEREITILFADLRSFTQLSERKLPYDVVFVLNQYFRTMGEAIEGSGGRVDKFIGDGIMALFGMEGTESAAGAGCREAIAAVRAMSRSLHDLNAALAPDLPEPLRIGIGVHMGTAIVGMMGYGTALTLTAIGDAVNVASRLEQMSKTLACEAVISAEVARRAGCDLAGYPTDQVAIRGRAEPMLVHAVAKGDEIPASA